MLDSEAEKEAAFDSCVRFEQALSSEWIPACAAKYLTMSLESLEPPQHAGTADLRATIQTIVKVIQSQRLLGLHQQRWLPTETSSRPVSQLPTAA